jgi:multiple sugar transport system substrate-binding protein
MWPGASWFVHHVFPATYFPEVEGNEGKVGVAMLPHWEDQETPFTGKRGGSAWVMSKHTINPQLSSELIIWLTTSEYQESVAGGFPAYRPAADVWCENKPAGPLFANDPCPILREAAGLVWPGMDLARVSLWEPFQTAIINPIIDGGSAVESLPGLAEVLTPLAQEVGYEIITEGP